VRFTPSVARIRAGNSLRLTASAESIHRHKELTVNKPEVSRRRFLAQVAIAVPAGAVLLDAALLNNAAAQNAGQNAGQAAAPAALPKLDPAEPSAKQLLYVEDATKVDRKSPLAARYTPDQTCATCSQLQGKAGDAYRPCTIFPGKLVSAKGWCSVWAKKA
jgi:hypothetical protein